MPRLLKHAASSALMVLLVVIFCSNYNSLSGQCPDLQYQALMDFHNSAGGDEWRRSDGWGEDCEYCNWYGVTCDGSGNVIEIRLKGNRLSGNIPSSIQELSSLKVLDLSNNSFISSLPEELGNLPALEILDIGYSKLNGAIPASIGNLKSLITLTLSGNPFSGGLPESIGNLSSLETLNIFNTDLSGEIPSSLGTLSNLKALHIGVNNFSGSIPPSLGNLNSLETFELVLESISGNIPPEIGNLSSLKYLYIQHTDIEGEIPNSIGNLSSLEELYINNNLVSGEIPASLGNLSHLYELYLINNNLSGPIPQTIGNLHSLVRFYGYSNQLDGPLPESLGQLIGLKTLDLSNNLITGEMPVTMASLATLQTLFLHNNKLIGEIPSSFGQMSSIVNLDLGANYLTGCIPESLIGWCNLSYVITEPNCFVKPLSSFCSGDSCNGLIDNPVEGEPVCEGEPITISAVNDQMDYLWSNGSQEQYLELQPIDNIAYAVTATNAYGCYMEAETQIEVNKKSSMDIAVEICHGENFSVGNETFENTGYYSVTLTDINGCDSTVNLSLSVLDQNKVDIFASICEGEEYVFGSNTLTQEGIYQLQLSDQKGCDSIVILDLEVLQREVIEIADTVCFGESFDIFGQEFNYEGSYEFFVDRGGICESKILLTLTHLPKNRTIIDTTLCSGSSVYFFDTWLSEEGTYTIPHTNQYGCDSIVQLNLTVNNPIETFTTVTLCEGDSYSFNGLEISTFGSYQTTLESSKACDSIVYLNVDVINIDTITIDTILCSGEILTINNEEYSSAGSYHTSLPSTDGCADLMVIHLDYYDPARSELVVSICEGETYNFNGTSLSLEGDYTGIFYGSEGCDSIVALRLEVFENFDTILHYYICPEETINIGDSIISEPGEYIFPFTSQKGCDSTVVVNISIIEEEIDTVFATICAGDTYFLNGNSYSEAGQYRSSTGTGSCVHSTYLFLNVEPLPEISLYQEICPGSVYMHGGMEFYEEGSYNYILSGAESCDTTVMLDLKFKVVEEVEIMGKEVLCKGDELLLYTQGYDFYDWSNGSQDSIITVAEAGIYSVNVTDSNGCMSSAQISVEFVSHQINYVDFADNQSCTDPSGIITIDASSDTGILEYSIDGGNSWQEDSSFTNLGGGAYNIVTRIKETGCIRSMDDPVYLNDLNNMDYEVVVMQEPLCFGDQDGIAYVEIYEEASIKSIIWSDGYVGNYRENLPAGTHNVKIETASGCVQFVSVNISEPEPITYDESFAPDTIICIGEVLTISKPLPEYDYSWYGPMGFIADTHAITLKDPGLYLVEISDHRGCVLKDSVFVDLVAEDFSGIDFLLSKEGMMDVPMVIVDVSWPVAENVEWQYNGENILMLDSVANQMIVEFQDTGMYEISMLATIGECSTLISKEIMIYKGEDLSDPNFLLSGYIQDVNIFPNPNFGVFSVRTTLSHEAAILITIVNTAGNMVYQKNLAGENLYSEVIDISSEPVGVYAVIIQTERETRYYTISKN